MTQAGSPEARSVGAARLISRAAASGGLPSRALPRARLKRSVAPPTGTPRLRLRGRPQSTTNVCRPGRSTVRPAVASLPMSLELADGHAALGQGLAQPAHEGQRLRVVAVDAEGADAALAQQPLGLAHRLVGV